MKTSGHHENSKLVARLIIFPFLLSFLNQPAFAGDTTLLGGDPPNQPTVSIPKNASSPQPPVSSKAASYSAQQTGPLSKITSQSTRAAAPVQSLTEEEKKIGNLKDAYLTLLQLEIEGNQKDVLGLAGLTDRLNKEVSQIDNTDRVISDLLSNNMQTRVQNIKTSISGILASLPSGYTFPQSLVTLGETYRTAAQSLIDTGMPEALTGYQSDLNSRKGYLNVVLGVYGSYKSAMETYFSSVKNTNFADAGAFYTMVGQKPPMGSEPPLPTLTNADFPPSSYVPLINNANDYFIQIRDILATMKIAGENEVRRLLGAWEARKQAVINQQQVVNTKQQIYKLALQGGNGDEIKKALDDLNAERGRLSDAKEAVRGAKTRLDNAQTDLDKINAARQKVNEILRWVVSNIIFTYGLKNTRYIYANTGTLKHENKFDTTQRLDMQNKVFDSYLDDLIARETAESKRLKREYNTFAGFVENQSGPKSESLKEILTQFATDAVGNITLLSGSLPSAMSWPDTLKIIMAKAKSDSQGMIDTLIDQAFKKYLEYLGNMRPYKETVWTNHRDHLQALQNFKDGLAGPSQNPFSLLAQIPKGAVDGRAPNVLKFPPDSSITYMSDSLNVFVSAAQTVGTFKTTAVKEMKRLKTARDLRNETLKSKEAEVVTRQKYLDQVAKKGGSASEILAAEAALAAAKVDRDAAKSLFDGAELRYQRAIEDVDRLNLTARFVDKTSIKMTNDIKIVNATKL